MTCVVNECVARTRAAALFVVTPMGRGSCRMLKEVLLNVATRFANSLVLAFMMNTIAFSMTHAAARMPDANTGILIPGMLKA